MTPIEDIFRTRALAAGRVRVGNNSSVKIQAQGRVSFATDKGPDLASLDNVYHVPQLGVNLLSV